MAISALMIAEVSRPDSRPPKLTGVVLMAYPTFRWVENRWCVVLGVPRHRVRFVIEAHPVRRRIHRRAGTIAATSQRGWGAAGLEPESRHRTAPGSDPTRRPLSRSPR